jgi:hypothetical protein
MKNHPTSFEIALGIKMRILKTTCPVVATYGVTCTYGEVLRFKH